MSDVKSQMSGGAIHVPVMLDEVLELLCVRSNKNYVDATLGGGGYTIEILKRSSPHGKIFAIDQDKEAIERAKEKFGNIAEVGSSSYLSVTGKPEPRPHANGKNSDLGNVSKETQINTDWTQTNADTQKRIYLVEGNFKDIEEIVRLNGFKNVAGVVFDLGLSSDLIDRSGRGFSFLRDEPLLMTYHRPTQTEHGQIRTAREIINSLTVSELEGIFLEYGEERQSGKIARAIVEERKQQKIETTFDLNRAIEKVSRSVKTKARIFQALRIAVNDELNNLLDGLAGAWGVVESGGRVVVVSFNSLEDRIVKNFFKEKEKLDEGLITTKKPLRPTRQEVIKNSRSRSARLRAIQKV
jgi:16S rRNA (cytosine1402-N4)-methyltransferase